MPLKLRIAKILYRSAKRLLLKSYILYARYYTDRAYNLLGLDLAEEMKEHAKNFNGFCIDGPAHFLTKYSDLLDRQITKIQKVN